MRVAVDAELKRKCPRTALGCVTAQVMTGASPEALTAELCSREEEILRLADPTAVLAAPEIRATREAYKALGKDPARYRGSAEALLRRIVAGKGLPQINAVVDIINLVSVESRMPLGLYDLEKVSGKVTFRAGRSGETYKGIGKYELNLEGLPVFLRRRRRFRQPDERFRAHQGHAGNPPRPCRGCQLRRRRQPRCLACTHCRPACPPRRRLRFRDRNGPLSWPRSPPFRAAEAAPGE